MNKHPWPVSVLCLCMAGLTACSATRAQYAGSIPDARKSPVRLAGPDLVENWGIKSDGSEEADPEIAPGFLLNLRSAQDNKLNGDFRADFDGNLQLPYNVVVNAAGNTPAQLEQKLSELYRPYFKLSPDIKLRVQERRYWLDIRGLVQKPGRYLVERDASIDQVIVAAGGTSRDMPPQFVLIQKGAKSSVLDLNQYYTDGDSRAHILGWIGGEVLFFRKELADSLRDKLPPPPLQRPVYVLGEVRKPGAYSMQPGSDLLAFLTRSDGFTAAADLDRIDIIRQAGDNRRVYELSWRKFGQAPAPIPGDIVMVHANQQSKSERRFQLGAVIASLLTSLASLAVAVNHR